MRSRKLGLICVCGWFGVRGGGSLSFDFEGCAASPPSFDPSPLRSPNQTHARAGAQIELVVERRRVDVVREARVLRERRGQRVRRALSSCARFRLQRHRAARRRVQGGRHVIVALVQAMRLLLLRPLSGRGGRAAWCDVSGWRARAKCKQQRQLAMLTIVNESPLYPTMRL